MVETRGLVCSKSEKLTFGRGSQAKRGASVESCAGHSLLVWAGHHHAVDDSCVRQFETPMRPSDGSPDTYNIHRMSIRYNGFVGSARFLCRTKRARNPFEVHPDEPLPSQPKYRHFRHFKSCRIRTNRHRPLQGPSSQAGPLCPVTRHHFRVACLAPLCLRSPSRPLPRVLPRSREPVRAVPAHLLL